MQKRIDASMEYDRFYSVLATIEFPQMALRQCHVCKKYYQESTCGQGFNIRHDPIGEQHETLCRVLSIFWGEEQFQGAGGGVRVCPKSVEALARQTAPGRVYQPQEVR
ncbi:hypothetical protein DSCO28_68130 [Desulfosarcina ovata subsp. sediminis]|uniref:Uncharacterized protein n=1 Tax=Desulfosarcina ovata subsp. sediminis TaxID=885957 RepID=A0A5K8A199_9BACT|nr:hypothetical protein [Desulfosarcina ovata]BBO86247.1 hypothetical protein DSCO28_68130 [Desulfosarcina ovata subsp. sediminis]